MKSNKKPPEELENTYDPENEEFDITTDEDMLRWRADEITEKPCHLLRYCPYATPIVEAAPVPEHFSRTLCDVHKHPCPVFFFAEPWEDMDFVGIAFAEKMLESMEHKVERANNLPPRTEE